MNIAMIFPGYGSQYVGMGKELYDESRIVQEFFEEAANCLTINFVKLCFASSDVELGRAEHAYTALFVLGAALAALLKEQGIVPTIVAGYDTGQFTSLHAVGGISFPDGLYLLSKYAAFFNDFTQTTAVKCLRVISADREMLEQACLNASKGLSLSVNIGIYDAYQGDVVAGNKEAVDHVYSAIHDQPGIQIIDLDKEVGLHNALMEGVEASIAVYSEKVDFHSTSAPVITGGDAMCVQDGALLKESTLHILDRPLVWDRVIQQLAPYPIVVQVGPGDTLLAHVAHLFPEKLCIAINKQQDIDKLKSMIESLQ